jgi:hypothetical protein
MTFEAHLAGARHEISPVPPEACADASSPIRAAELLAQNGFVVVRNFLDRAMVLHETERLATELATYVPLLRQFATVEHAQFIINCRAERFSNYGQLAAAPKPVFNVRNTWGEDAPDAGFVDLFRPEELFTNLPALIEILATGLPASIVSHLPTFTGGPTYAAKHCNLYINLEVTNTRGFHIDSEAPYIKAFLYLTDVLRMEDGPYCYVPKSHRDKLIQSLNKRYNGLHGHRATDMFLTNPADGVAFLAPAGTLILTYQSGIHRGYPQAENSRRLALVQRFEPIR